MRVCRNVDVCLHLLYKKMLLNCCSKEICRTDDFFENVYWDV